MTAMLDQAAADPQQIIADLQRKLDARTAELQEKNERYALVSQAVAEGIYDWDIARNALWVSPRLIEIFGWGEPGPDAGARPSQDWNARVHPDDFEHYRAALRAALKGETARLHCEYRIRLSSGEYRWVEDHALPVRDERGWAVRLVGAVSDVTERKEAEQALREALEQQTATAQILEVINRSPGNLAPVFEAMVERAVQLCEADEAAVRSFDGKLLHLVAAHGDPDALEKLRELGPSNLSRPGQPAGLYDPFTRGEHVVHIADVRETEAFRKSPIARKRLQLRNIRTWLAVALSREGTLLGVINVHRHEVRPFSEKQIALLQNFAAQAVIAMENARLLGELQARTRDLEELLEYQTATSDVLNVISRSTSDVQPVLDTVVETAARLCGSDTGAIFIREGEVYRAVSGYAADVSAADTEFWAIQRQRRFVPGRDSVAGRVALEGRVVHVADALSDPDYAFPESIASGRRTMLGVPLLREGAVIGTINLSRKRVQPYTERQIELVRTFADQAVIAIENARLLGELQARTRDLEESLEYQTATSDVLKVIARSTSDVQAVMDTVTETAARLCDSDFAAITTREGEVYRYVSMSSSAADPEVWQILRQRTIVPGRESTAGRVALEGTVVHVADILADPDYAVPESVAAGYRTQLGVPLLREGAVLGTINLGRKRVEPFTERQIELVRTFADQAVIAIENARLLGELQARTRDLEESLEYQTATSDVLNVISRSTSDVQPVLDTVAETAVRLCGADTGGIAIREDEVYRYVAQTQATAADAEHWESLRQRTIVPGRNSVAGRVALEGRVVHVADIRADPDYALPAAVASGRRTMLGVPLLRDGEPIGVIVLSRKRVEPFTERQIELVRTFADQAVIAMENARLLTELRESTGAADRDGRGIAGHQFLSR